jgi:hypothetical protein
MRGFFYFCNNFVMQICILQKKVKYLYIAKLTGGERLVAHGNAQ